MSSAQGICVLDFLSEKGKIEQVILADGTYSYDEIVSYYLNSPNYLGDLSWSDLNSIFNASEINAGIDFYKNWHESVSFSDTESPTLVRVYSKSDDVGNNPVVDSAPVIYHPGDSFNITAEFSEEILAGSSITVTFNTGVDVVLEAQENSQFMIGSYIVTRGLHTNTPDLSVVSISINEPVYDLYGNALVDIPLPSGGENAFANMKTSK